MGPQEDRVVAAKGTGERGGRMIPHPQFLDPPLLVSTTTINITTTTIFAAAWRNKDVYIITFVYRMPSAPDAVCWPVKLLLQKTHWCANSCTNVHVIVVLFGPIKFLQEKSSLQACQTC